jgi:hypothetical protein
MVAVYYDRSYTEAEFAFPTTRKSQWIAESLTMNPIPRIDVKKPRSAHRTGPSAGTRHRVHPRRANG